MSQCAVNVHGVTVLTRGPQLVDRGADPDAYRQGLARRREAAWRSEPLPGMPAVPELPARDPLAAWAEPAPPPAVLADVLVVEVSGHTAWLMGVDNYRARNLLDRLGVPRLFDVSRRCWTCPAKRLHEVSAAVEARGDSVLVVEVTT